MILNPRKKYELREEIFTYPNIRCGTKFMQEFIFVDCRFFVFLLGINFCDFQKVHSTRH